ncbi:MAG: hypothetical protein KAY59_09950, partial [Acidobacteria bacterium]|nr:hypothetical protein [Acidobacteriota bacterium]
MPLEKRQIVEQRLELVPISCRLELAPRVFELGPDDVLVIEKAGFRDPLTVAAEEDEALGRRRIAHSLGRDPSAREREQDHDCSHTGDSQTVHVVICSIRLTPGISRTAEGHAMTVGRV